MVFFFHSYAAVYQRVTHKSTIILLHAIPNWGEFLRRKNLAAPCYPLDFFIKWSMFNYEIPIIHIYPHLSTVSTHYPLYIPVIPGDIPKGHPFDQLHALF